LIRKDLAVRFVDGGVAFVGLDFDWAWVRISIYRGLGWFGLGGSCVLSGLVKMAFVHGDGNRRMASEGIKGETWKIDQPVVAKRIFQSR
jgi:hypothetical protein